MKGVKKPISYKDSKSLLFKDKFLNIDQEKWYRNIELGQIKVDHELYHLTATDNKRKLI